MSEPRFLTPSEVCQRYRQEFSVGTLKNWRIKRIGPSYVKLGRSVLYPIDELDAWDRKNKVRCHASAGPDNAADAR